MQISFEISLSLRIYSLFNRLYLDIKLSSIFPTFCRSSVLYITNSDKRIQFVTWKYTHQHSIHNISMNHFATWKYPYTINRNRLLSSSGCHKFSSLLLLSSSSTIKNRKQNFYRKLTTSKQNKDSRIIGKN